ncbi:MAG: signal recognition particle-docking protein FtsY, partial [Phycisphaerae bacterium]|nr:signal recognition particle-docking protein FtsY [Phycisphaerae bacterium]
MAMFRKAIEKLSRGLSRTKQRFVGGLKALLAGRALDETLLDELAEQLIQADIGVKTALRIREDLETARKENRITSGDEVIDFLKAEMKAYWPEADRAVRWADSGPTVILVAGINGCGKTTSVAKLTWYFQQQGKKVVLAAGDTFRAAAVEQLTIWADRLGVDIIKSDGADPGAVVFDACDAATARAADVLLVDTAGRLHTQDNLMRELGKVRNVVAKKIAGAPHETLLVLDATTGQNAVNQARAFTEAIDATGIVLAKLDG